jgi:hypothetical protein
MKGNRIADGAHSEGAMKDAQLRSAAILNEPSSERHPDKPERRQLRAVRLVPKIVCNASKTASLTERYTIGCHKG